jgi:hypothetical protein
MNDEEHLQKIKQYVDLQAQDETIWLMPQSITESYLLQRLSELHQIIESDSEKFIDDKIKNYE